MGDDGLPAAMGFLERDGMVLAATYRCPITGCLYSDAFREERITAYNTPLYAFRERGARSAVTGQAYQVRQGDTQAVVLRLHDRAPSAEMSQADRDYYHGGYLGFATNSRSAAVELMDGVDTRLHVKVMVVYLDTRNDTWFRAGRKGSNGCWGRVYVFVSQEKLEELGPVVNNVLTSHGLV